MKSEQSFVLPLEKRIGPLAIQEYIQDYIDQNPWDVNGLIERPKFCDPVLWLYEHIRQLVIDLNLLVGGLSHICNSQSCPIMAIGQEKYKCTNHDYYKDCTAIDYSNHTLDFATELLIELRPLIARKSESKQIAEQLYLILRRMGRIMVHSSLKHKDFFEQFEGQKLLLERYHKICQTYTEQSQNKKSQSQQILQQLSQFLD